MKLERTGEEPLTLPGGARGRGQCRDEQDTTQWRKLPYEILG